MNKLWMVFLHCWQATLKTSHFLFQSFLVQKFLQFFSLSSARQHPSYDDCVEVKREYYQNSSVLDCITQCSQSATHLYEQLLQVQQIGFVTLGPLES